MSPLLQQVLSEIAQLAPEERLQLIAHIQHMENQTQPKKSWQDLEGIAPNLLKGQDAQDWVNQIREEWNDREEMLRG